MNADPGTGRARAGFTLGIRCPACGGVCDTSPAVACLDCGRPAVVPVPGVAAGRVARRAGPDWLSWAGALVLGVWLAWLWVRDRAPGDEPGGGTGSGPVVKANHGAASACAALQQR